MAEKCGKIIVISRLLLYALLARFLHNVQGNPLIDTSNYNRTKNLLYKGWQPF